MFLSDRPTDPSGLPQKLIVNVDGIESAREKWGGAAKKVLRFCMNEAVRAADVCVADNVAIREYVADRYGKTPW